MTRVTDARHGPVEVPGGRLVLGAGATDAGTLLAVDTLRRLLELRGQQVSVVGVPGGWEDLNVHPASGSGHADVLLVRPWEAGGPPYSLEHRLAWLSGVAPAQAREQLDAWRGEVARWAEGARAPFFAFVHLWDVHYDYEPPPTYDLFYPDYRGAEDGSDFDDTLIGSDGAQKHAGFE